MIAKTARSRILSFYDESDTDGAGRYLSEVMQFSDRDLESVHDYIQWLFPLHEPSGANPYAPLLTDEAAADFVARGLPDRLRRALVRMLEFYGLKFDGPDIVPAATFRARAAVWLSPNNHNHLRLTRMIASLRALGLPEEAQSLFACLSQIYHNEISRGRRRITDETFGYWQAAANKPVP